MNKKNIFVNINFIHKKIVFYVKKILLDENSFIWEFFSFSLLETVNISLKGFLKSGCFGFLFVLREGYLNLLIFRFL